MKYFTFLLLASIFNFSSAFAQKVELDKIQLLGRGIQNRETGETIAFACIDECKRMQMIYFTSDLKEAYWLGKPRVVVADKEELLEAAYQRELKAISKEFRSYKRTIHLADNNFKGTLCFGAIIVVLLATTNPAGLPLTFTLVIGSAALLVFQPGISKYSPVTATLSDRDGWNWSSSPRRVSKKKFDLLFTFGHQLDNTSATIVRH